MICLDSSDHTLIAPINHIIAELVRSSDKHPNYPVRHERRALILLEEAGEVTKAVVESTKWMGDADKYEVAAVDPPLNFPYQTYDELVQTAAMCLKFMRAMRKEYNLE